MRGFGYKQFESNEPNKLDVLLSQAEPTSMDAFEIAMLEAYQTAFEIFDHDNSSENDPLAIIAMHPREDTTSYSRLFGELYRFAEEPGLVELWGLDIQTYLDLPRDVSEEILRITREIMAKRRPKRPSNKGGLPYGLDIP